MATEAQAKMALEAIERGRQHVVDEIDLPRWYWWGLAAGWIGVGFVTDLDHPWATGIATLAFGAVHASAASVVLGGRRRTRQVSVRADVAGHHVPLLVIVSLLGLAALTTASGIWASADGARHPATAASIVVAVLIVLGGPRLMAAVRRRAARRSALV